EEFFIQVAQPLSPDILKTARYCLTKTLTDFQFTGLATPTLALSKSLNLNARSLAAQILPLDQPSATEEGLRIT
ncbi:MAG TPA: hypothetical protein VLH77_04815, partial [Gammaproteobacteria bacterium]|nr:hypothetical protein [Gammaproteobacteria bacterium]